MEAETTNAMLGKYLPFSPVQTMKKMVNKYKNRCENEKKKIIQKQICFKNINLQMQINCKATDKKKRRS